MKAFQGIVKINLKQSGAAYLATGILFLLGIASIVTMTVIPGGGESETVASSNYLYLLPLLTAIFVPARNFAKLMNLGGKRMDFFRGCIFTYLSVVAAVTFADTIMYFTFDRFVLTKLAGVLCLHDAFGFMARGPVVAFFQMTAFLLLFCCVLHTLTLIQGRWYGWLADALIIAVISVFTPIAPLRAALVWFFNMIIFHDLAAVQISSCLVLGAAVYCAGLIPIKTKQI